MKVFGLPQGSIALKQAGEDLGKSDRTLRLVLQGGINAGEKVVALGTKPLQCLNLVLMLTCLTFSRQGLVGWLGAASQIQVSGSGSNLVVVEQAKQCLGVVLDRTGSALGAFPQ
jgi:hypothetical protein